MRKCRNWQTSKTKDLVVVTSCGFKSHLPQEKRNPKLFQERQFRVFLLHGKWRKESVFVDFLRKREDPDPGSKTDTPQSSKKRTISFGVQFRYLQSRSSVSSVIFLLCLIPSSVLLSTMPSFNKRYCVMSWRAIVAHRGLKSIILPNPLPFEAVWLSV